MTSAAKLFEGRSSRPLSSSLHGSSNLSSNLMLPRSETKFKRKRCAAKLFEGRSSTPLSSSLHSSSNLSSNLMLPRSETKFKRTRCASSRCNVI